MKFKQLFVIALIAFTVSSCVSTKKSAAWVKENCTHEKVGEFDYTKCANLYPTDSLKEVCGQAVLCYDITGGSVELKSNCGDTPTLIAKGKKLLYKLFSFVYKK